MVDPPDPNQCTVQAQHGMQIMQYLTRNLTHMPIQHVWTVSAVSVCQLELAITTITYFKHPSQILLSFSQI